MDGQTKVFERLRNEAEQAALEAAEVVRQGEEVLDHAHEIAQAVVKKVRQIVGHALAHDDHLCLH
jgi:hypothetical protein